MLVSYKDAKAFCKWRSQKEGKEYRLPKEEEWEKAARGTDGRAYPWGDDFDKGKCNTRESKIGKTTDVTIYPKGASPFKCRDMAGNVWEWMHSWNDKEKNTITIRGGSWYDFQLYARCISSLGDESIDSFSGVGFRYART